MLTSDQTGKSINKTFRPGDWLVIDLDHEINRSIRFSHQTGITFPVSLLLIRLPASSSSEVLEVFQNILAKNTRSIDLKYKVNETTFAAILIETDDTGAQHISARVLREFSEQGALAADLQVDAVVISYPEHAPIASSLVEQGLAYFHSK